MILLLAAHKLLSTTNISIRMRQLTILLLLMVFCSINAKGQQNSRYISFLGKGGQVFFIKPHTIAAKAIKKEFEYDMTYVEGGDSLVFNFTVESSVPIKVEEFSIVNENGLQVKSAPCVKLFVDMRKKKYLIRTQTWFAYEDVKEVITASTQYSFVVKTSSDDIVFADKKSVWKKERKKLTEIFNIINVNNL